MKQDPSCNMIFWENTQQINLRAKLDLVKDPLQNVINEYIKKFPCKNFSQKKFYIHTGIQLVISSEYQKGKHNQKQHFTILINKVAKVAPWNFLNATSSQC
jgi:hypothetical protein